MLARLFARGASVLVVLSALGTFTARPLHAQGDVDIIVGTVTDASGKPVAGATVEVFSIQTEVTRPTKTNEKGQYRMVFPDGGGQYRISVKAIGKTPKIFNVARSTDDDRILLDVNLGDQAATLNTLVSNVARRPDADAAANRVGAGESSHNVTGDQALRLPIDASDLSAIAALAPGVILTAGTDSTASTFSVAGQSAAGNTYVVNGVTTSSSTLPADAVRSTRVITNTYDVSRGNFSGGMVSVTTKGGGNRVSGSVRTQATDQNLAFGGDQSNIFQAGTTRQLISGGFGGPLKKNVTSLFASAQYTRNLTPVPSLDQADVATLARLGASPDSVTKFEGLVSGLGLTQRAGKIDPNATAGAFSSVARFDWNIGASVLTFTGQASTNNRDPQSISSTTLGQVGGTSNGHVLSGQMRVSSRFGSVLNTLNGGYSDNVSSSTPFLYVPVGRVTNYSPIDSGGTAVTTFGFGGNSGMPRHSNTGTAEVTDEVSLISPAGAHRYILGLYGNETSFNNDVSNNQYGTYTYATLSDFQANLPSSFTRTLLPSVRSGSSINEAVYISDAWRPRIGKQAAAPAAGGDNGGGGGGFGGGGGGRGGRGGGGGGNPFGGFGGGNGGGNLQLNYGVRLEHSSYTGAPATNQAVLNEFGLDTHQLPTETYLSPRAGFSYTIAAPEQQGQAQRGFAPPLLTIRGGVGVFRGTMPQTLPSTAQAQSGLAGAQTQLYCTGAAVPIPDFQHYLDHPEDIPTECVDNASTPVILGTPTITGYDPNYGAAKTKRVSLGLTRRLTQRMQFNVDASYVRGVGQAASEDLNLRDTPQFTLGNEANRPVYADPTQIFPSTGVAPLAASRKDVAYGSVDRVFSGLQNETKQITFNVSGSTSKQITLSASYTLMFARDEGGSGGGFGGGFGGGNVTAGDPNVYTWATSSNERRHNLQLSGQWPVTPALELTGVIGITSGQHYTPLVSGDINGDGSRNNDRAFVFDPANTADTAVANGMKQLLASTSGNAKKCLEAALGTIANRNICTGPWAPQLQLQMNWRPALFQRRLAIQLSTQNLLGGLDQLINGENNLKGWDGNNRPDATLLTVKGFNPTTNQFIYSVNERFGNTSGSATARRTPFQLQVGLTYAIGFDQRTQQLQGLGRGGTTPPTGPQMLDSATTRLHRQSVAAAALARKDSLVLTKEQIARLQAVIDSSNARVAMMADSIRPEVEKVSKAGTAADYGPILQRIGPFMQSLTQEQARVKEQVHGILTDVQWALLPDAVKNPSNNFFGGGRGGPGGGGRGGPGGGGNGFGGRGGGE